MSSTPSDTPTPLAEISQGPSAFEAFLDRNQKLLAVLAVLIAIGTAAYVVYLGVEKSRQETAGAELIKAADSDELKKLIDEHTGTQAAKSAKVLLAETQWNSDEKDASIATLEGFLAEEPGHPAAPSAKASLAAKLMSMDKSAEAVRLFDEIVSEPEARYLAPYALICIGDIAAAAGDKAKAEDSYSRAVADYPGSDFEGTAKGRLRDINAKPPVVVVPPAPVEIPVEEPAAQTPDGAPAPANEAPATPESAVQPGDVKPATEQAPKETE